MNKFCKWINSRKKEKIPYACFYEMTNLGNYPYMFPYIKNGKPENSQAAEIFCNKVYEKCGVKAVASFLWGTVQLDILLWIKENENPGIFTNTTSVSIHYGEHYFDEIVKALTETLEMFSENHSEKANELYENAKRKEPNPFLYITMISYERRYLDNLYSKYADVIENEIKSIYPQYEKLRVCAFSKEMVDSYHPIILFFTPEELKDAQEKEHIKEMIETAKRIYKQNDILDLFDSENFMPYVCSRRDISAELLNWHGLI